MIKLLKGDCLERLIELPDNSIDLCLTDPPFGSTACKWDSVIPFESMWEQLTRVVKDNGAILLFGTEPFSSLLNTSNLEMYRYNWEWVKSRKNGFVHAKGMPLRETERISVFSKGSIRRNANKPMCYYPQDIEAFTKKRVNYVKTTSAYSGGHEVGTEYEQQGFGYPTNLICFKNESPKTQVHPTQKPVDLLEYLIKTYTLEGETVLDFTMGSGSTGVAAVNTNRSFIGIERDPNYFKIAKGRVTTALADRKTVGKTSSQEPKAYKQRSLFDGILNKPNNVEEQKHLPSDKNTNGTLHFNNVLSLFDGMSCGQLALNRAGITYDNYHASEIDAHAIKVTQHNFPNTIQLGSVTEVTGDKLPKIDLLIGGSPCQGFSFSGKGLNFEDPRSKLFFEYVRLLKEVKPKYFLLENVVMKKEYEDVISEYLGVSSILINSSLVSGQNRNRLYWTNIPNVQQPADRGIKLQDLLEDEPPVMLNSAAIRGRYLNKAAIIGRRLNDDGHREDYNKEVKIVQCLEVRATNLDKSNCLTTVAKDNVLTPLPVGRHPDVYGNKLPYRNLTATEMEKLQTVPVGYSSIVSTSQRTRMLGNGWTVDVIAHILSHIPKD